MKSARILVRGLLRRRLLIAAGITKIFSKTERWLNIDVSEHLEKRALRIFQSIFIEVEKRGYHFEVEKDKWGEWRGCDTYIVVRNHKIAVMIREIRKRVQQEDNRWWRTSYQGTGGLKFVCKDPFFSWSDSYRVCAAQDTVQIRLEDKIEHIIEVVEKLAANKEEKDEWIEKEHERLRLEEEKKRREEEERLKIELRKRSEITNIKVLLMNAGRYDVAQLIRSYADNYKKRLILGNDNDEEEEYIKWIYEKADFIDPFVKRKDDCLEESDISRIIGQINIGVSRIKDCDNNISSDSEYFFWKNRNGWRKK